ncbi:hypothetical protein D9757_009301 [Collybiopsis confluens]|uniref:TFIIS N-terminal domain-containing protein n=1 Tax=Collybiopsis confluens TaxID=2823264 RepID=A0A8H5H3S5_9AGAR|nr:hypothetical protein D9757_009301 [Collybiopsis confluens]
MPFPMAIVASLFLVLTVTRASDYPFPYDPGFDIQAVAAIAKALPSHSWEFGTATEALLELYNPSYSVFGSQPFPVPTLDKDEVPALAYAADKIILGQAQNGLSDGDGAVGDPASLGVGAVLLGKTDSSFAGGAFQEFTYITGQAPRFWNGAISQRVDVAELWADFIYMAPPFLAYYAVDTSNTSLLQLAVDQCGLYRQVLQANLSSSVPWDGVWEHIIGPQSADLGLWGTGNGWASAGMTRVLATVMNAPGWLTLGWKDQAVDNLTGWIQEIVDGAIGAPLNDGLLRNYLDDTSNDGHGFQDISGSSLIAAVAYRMAVLQPSSFGEEYIQWADDIRTTLGSNDANGNPHVTANGTVTPAVNPLGWTDTTPYTAGSPEGNNFVVLMYAAWRDCIDADVCEEPAASKKKLARDIFGGSDSELSSDEDEVQDHRRQPRPYDDKLPGGEHDRYGDGEGDGEGEGDGDSEDDYREDRPSSSIRKKKLSSRPKQRRTEGDEGDGPGIGDGVRKRKRTTSGVAKKKKKSAYEDIDLNELPPEQANKIRLDMQIEAILKPKKGSRPKKRKNNEEVLDSFADDEVARLRETMNNAADEDIKAKENKLPATAKLRFLNEAMETLRKAALAQSISDNNLLDAVRRWLEPLPDRSLPALNIQRELFAALRKMEFIDSAVIKEAQLGPLVLFYTKCRRVTPDVKRIASELVSSWSRPIIKRSASYRDRVVPVMSRMDVDDTGPGGGGGSQMHSQYRPEKLSSILAKAREEDKRRVRKNAVTIPTSSLGTYTFAPRNNAGMQKMNASVDNDVERRKKNAERLKSLTRKATGK